MTSGSGIVIGAGAGFFLEPVLGLSKPVGLVLGAVVGLLAGVAIGRIVETSPHQ